MLKKLIIPLIVLASLISFSYAASDLTLSCEYTMTPSPYCSLSQNTLFHANDLVNAHASFFDVGGYYGYKLCCTVGADGSESLDISLESTNVSLGVCSNASSEAILFLTNLTNTHVSKTLSDPLMQQYKLCVGISDSFAALDLKWVDDNDAIFNSVRYDSLDYTCLFRVNNLVSGHIGSCDDPTAQSTYDYSVWGRLFESDSSLVCKADCTSVLDNRVYSSCGLKVDECRDVAIDCDGSLYGAWVPYASVDPSKDIQCSAPWNNVRETTSSGNLNIKTVENKCQHLVKVEYNVLVNSELVTMSVFVCED